jgi:IS30 family transposase
MEDKFQDILNNLPEQPPRSRLEMYRELIDELRRRGWPYRDIVGILADKCHVSVSVSTLHDFVRVRSLGKRNPAKRAAPNETKGALMGTDQKASDDAEVRRRIAALQARTPATTPSIEDIDFDPREPLRLITPGKPSSAK